MKGFTLANFVDRHKIVKNLKQNTGKTCAKICKQCTALLPDFALVCFEIFKIQLNNLACVKDPHDFRFFFSQQQPLPAAIYIQLVAIVKSVKTRRQGNIMAQ